MVHASLGYSQTDPKEELAVPLSRDYLPCWGICPYPAGILPCPFPAKGGWRVADEVEPAGNDSILLLEALLQI